MDRKKPTLTSPWKVGFLVALLLVVTALGVTYFITGVFAIKWHWIQVGGLSPTTWTFHLGAFLEEMAPLLLITSLLAVASYVLVAGAVRRYKAYVDSGVEYKQLLKSIKSIEDLDTVDVADRLKSHPELREFLMGVKRRAAALESPGSERLARHTQPMQPPQNAVSRDTVASECTKLVEAIDAGRDNFPREIALTIPELKQIERTLRRVFSELPQTPVAADPSAGALEELKNSVRTTLDALRGDVTACGNGAREVEQAVLALQNQGGSATQPKADTAAVQKRVDAVGEALVMLGEETRRIAIASAVQASGGPDADTIKVADELKVLATRFNTVARHWGETTPALREILAGAATPKAGADTSGATAQAANRARLWGERAVAMNEHVRSLERAIGVTPSRSTSGGAPSSAAIDLDSTPAPTAGAAHESTEDLGAGAQMFGDTSGDISFADIPGFEKEHRFFADPPASADAADARFVVDNTHERRWDLSEENADEAHAAAQARAEAKHAPDPDGFLTGPRPTVKSQRTSPPPAPARAAAPALAPVAASQPEPVLEDAAVATATLDVDADAMDLYALGAIDCVQTV